jgi:hypothetical protein
VRKLTLSLVGLMALVVAPPVSAQEDCSRTVIFTLPGVVWEDVVRYDLPNILETASEGSVASIAVRTNSSRTSYASGYATIGAGTRTDGGRSAGAVAYDQPEGLDGSGYPAPHFQHDVPASGVSEIEEIAKDADYHAEAGAFAEVVDGVVAIGNGDPGLTPPTPAGWGRWPLLAAMDRSGVTDSAAVGSDLLVEDAKAPFGVRSDPVAMEESLDVVLENACVTLVVMEGDLARVDRYGLLVGEPSSDMKEKALLAADSLLGPIAGQLDFSRDLLLVVSPTSPWWDSDVHLGVAIARGPGFPAGTTLDSASTRQTGFVTLPDIAPTVLEHLGIDRPDSMLGRPFVPVEASGDLVQRQVDIDAESVFAHGLQAGLATGFVIFQIVIYLTAFFLLTRRDRAERSIDKPAIPRWLQLACLAIIAYPLGTYLATPIEANAIGTPWFVASLIAIDLALVALVSFTIRSPLDRVLALTAATIFLFILDLTFLDALQLNAVFGNDPIVAGRFTGLGNIAFAILGTTSLLTGALMVNRWGDRSWVFWAVGALFAVTVIVDGAPALGSDVGGIISLVPVLSITFLLLLGKRPTVRTILIAVVAGVVALVLFLLVDLSRPPESRTHLGRLFEDIRARGFDVFTDTIARKIRTNLRVFRSTIWTYLVPPALAVIAWLLLRPQGRWQRLATTFPKVRAGLIGGLLLAVVGFAVNDSGIVVPAMVLSYLAPMSLLLHLVLERAGDREAEEP